MSVFLIPLDFFVKSKIFGFYESITYKEQNRIVLQISNCPLCILQTRIGKIQVNLLGPKNDEISNVNTFKNMYTIRKLSKICTEDF